MQLLKYAITAGFILATVASFGLAIVTFGSTLSWVYFVTLSITAWCVVIGELRTNFLPLPRQSTLYIIMTLGLGALTIFTIVMAVQGILYPTPWQKAWGIIFLASAPTTIGLIVYERRGARNPTTYRRR